MEYYLKIIANFKQINQSEHSEFFYQSFLKLTKKNLEQIQKFSLNCLFLFEKFELNKFEKNLKNLQKVSYFDYQKIKNFKF